MKKVYNSKIYEKLKVSHCIILHEKYVRQNHQFFECIECNEALHLDNAMSSNCSYVPDGMRNPLH